MNPRHVLSAGSARANAISDDAIEREQLDLV